MLDNLLKIDLNHILAHTNDLWGELHGQRIFITGGTGFLGHWMLESFVWANDQIGLDAQAVVLTRDPDSFLKNAPHLATHPAIKLHVGDVRSFDFPSGHFSHIIHMATETSQKLNVEEPLLMLDTIVQGTRHTLDFAHFCGVKKLLLVSSGAVYGRQPPELSHIPEDYIGAPDVMDPGSAYGEGKRLAEYLCLIYKRYGIESKIARGFAFVGPYLPLNIHFAIGNFIGDAINGQPIQVKGDGTPSRSYLYAADAAIWLWTILFHGQPCRPYNVGSGRRINIAELAELVRQVVNPDVGINIAQRADPARPLQQYVPLIERAQQELGLDVWISLEQAIEKTCIWLGK